MHRLKGFEFRFGPTLMIALLLFSASPTRAGWQWTELFAAHPVDREMRVTAMVEHQGSIFVAGYPLEIVSVGDPLDVLLQRHTDGTWSSVLTREDFYAYPSTSVQDVRCLLSTASGLVVGGTFDVLADSAGYSNIALYQQGQWSKLGLGLPRSPWVLAEHRGELYAGCYSRGTLSASVGYGTPSDSTRATLWRFDGVDWIPLPPIPGTRISLTRALLSRPEGLWVGGFYEADGGPYGTALLENGVWTLPGGGLQSTLPPTSVVPLHVLQGVTSLVDYQGSVYASGSFRSPAIQAVARYDAGSWSDLGVEGSVEVLHEHRGALVAIGNATFPRAAAAPR